VTIAKDSGTGESCRVAVHFRLAWGVHAPDSFPAGNLFVKASGWVQMFSTAACNVPFLRAESHRKACV
jgi:hypothetical protein